MSDAEPLKLAPFVMQLNASLDAVEAVRKSLSPRLQQEGLSARELNRIEVVLEELLANVARHGSPGADVQNQVRVTAKRTDSGLLIIIEDDATPFDPTKVAPPVAARSIEEAEPGGWGVALVRKFATRFDYEQLTNDRQGGAAFAPVNRITVELAVSPA